MSLSAGTRAPVLLGLALLAAVADAAAPQDDHPCPAVSAEDALQQLNAWREKAQPCDAGVAALPVAGPVVWGPGLQGLAQQQAQWLARHGRLVHRGAGGEDLAQRARDNGYAFARITENLAHGQRSLAQALAGWQASPGHCQNLHDSRVSEMALACAPDARGRLVWVLVLARPLR